MGEEKDLKILEHFDEIIGGFREHLIEMNKRWGETYLQYNKADQEDRIRWAIESYFMKFKNVGKPVPWYAVMGNAYIAILRETHPEMSDMWKGD